MAQGEGASTQGTAVGSFIKTQENLGGASQFQVHKRAAETPRARSPAAPRGAAHSHGHLGLGAGAVLGGNCGELGGRSALCMSEVRGPCRQAWPLHTPRITP